MPSTGVILIDRWHLWHWVGSGDTPDLCDHAGRRGFGAIDGIFVWQAWRLVPSSVTLSGSGTYGSVLALVVRLGLCDGDSLRGKRGMTGVASAAIDGRFVWHVWHSVAWQLQH